MPRVRVTEVPAALTLTTGRAGPAPPIPIWGPARRRRAAPVDVRRLRVGVPLPALRGHREAHRGERGGGRAVRYPGRGGQRPAASRMRPATIATPVATAMVGNPWTSRVIISSANALIPETCTDGAAITFTVATAPKTS